VPRADWVTATGETVTDNMIKTLQRRLDELTVSTVFTGDSQTSDPQPVPEEPGLPGYSLAGWFQGKHYAIEDIQWDESPIELVIRAVLGLEDGDELQSFLVKTKEGASDIRSLPE
jgi:hypothetical protein